MPHVEGSEPPALVLPDSCNAQTLDAVIGFFWRRGDRHWWTHILAPGLAAVGLFCACYLIIDNYPLLTGSGWRSSTVCRGCWSVSRRSV